MVPELCSRCPWNAPLYHLTSGQRGLYPRVQQDCSKQEMFFFFHLLFWDLLKYNWFMKKLHVWDIYVYICLSVSLDIGIHPNTITIIKLINISITLKNVLVFHMCLHMCLFVCGKNKKQFSTGCPLRAQYKVSRIKFHSISPFLKEVSLHNVKAAGWESDFQSVCIWVLTDILPYGTLTDLGTLPTTGSY